MHARSKVQTIVCERLHPSTVIALDSIVCGELSEQPVLRFSLAGNGVPSNHTGKPRVVVC
jgi:hypothetical protein